MPLQDVVYGGDQQSRLYFYLIKPSTFQLCYFTENGQVLPKVTAL